MARDIQYTLEGSVSIDTTIQTIYSGHHLNTHVRYPVAEGKSYAVPFHKGVPLGKQLIMRVMTRKKGTGQLWLGQLQALTSVELRMANKNAKNARGGAWIDIGSGDE